MGEGDRDRFDIYLASQSPRRRALLAQLGLACLVLEVQVDESPQRDEAPATYVERIAWAKAAAGRTALLSGKVPASADAMPGAPLPAQPVLAADTAVVIDGRILGKPADERDAMAMLACLSGRTHRVLTAVAVLGAGEHLAVSTSEVRFRSIAPAEAAAYWATGEPKDKAGAYGIQGLGATFVAHLAGSYSGVVGLPLFETAQLLAAEGIGWWRPSV